MRGFDPRWRLGFAALCLGLTGLILARHGLASLVMLEVFAIALAAAAWTGITGLADLRRGRGRE